MFGRVVCVLGLMVGCGPGEQVPIDGPCSGADALSDCLVPTQIEQHYIEESHAYFDTMDYEPVGTIEPAYATQVVRWEWPPWLQLTGFGAAEIVATDSVLVWFPSVVRERDCRAFDSNPFGRCIVTFYYDDHDGRSCPIYEEFTFNDAGEITWIEAWSNQSGYLPMADASDTFGEASGNTRLSARIPGLGTETGAIDLDGDAMQTAASTDSDIANFVERARDWKSAWAELVSDTDQDAMWAEGCGW